jgi:predicted nucleic acid-binding protein
MPNACFIDTNVLLYVKDPTAPTKQARAIEWLDVLADRNLAVVNPQVLNEFAHNVIKKLPHIGYEALVENLESMRPWCTAPMNDETALQGLAIRRRFKFSFYDATLVAAAIAGDCDMFLSEDLGHDVRIGALRIVNPFLADPRTLLEKD